MPSELGHRTWLALLLTVGSATAVHADDEPKDSGLVETATVRAREQEKATADVTVIDREQIDALNPISVAELIQFVTGFNLAGTGARGGIATAQVRGGDPNFTVVLLDGVPLNDSTDVFGGSVNLNALPVTMVERVEFARGPQSSFLGSFGLAGAINIITRRGDTDRTAVDVTLGTGNASYRQGSVSVSKGNDKANGFVGATWEREETRVADESFEQFALQGNFGARLSPGAELRFTGRVASSDIDDYREGSGGPVYGDGQLRNSEHDELNLGLELWLGRTERRHLIRATLYRQELDRFSPAIFPAAPESLEHNRFLDLQVGWNVPVVLNDRDSVTVGIQVRNEDGQSSSTFFLPFPPIPVDSDYDLQRTTPGAYVEWLGQRGPILIEVGARVDAPEDVDTQWSPRFGLVWSLPNEATRLRTSWSRGYKLPSFFALGSSPLLGGNPDLEPEVAVGADLGVEHRFASIGLGASLTVFHNDYEDLIDFDFAEFRFENLSDVRAQGVEFGANWTSPKAFSVRFNATWQDVENRETGEILRHRPDWVVGGRFTWMLDERFRWQIDGQWKSEIRDEQIPVPDRDTVPAWSTLGTTVALDLTDAWEMRVRIDNLFDKTYETFIGFPGAGRAARVNFICRARSIAQ